MHLNKKSLKQQGGQMIPQQPGMQSQEPMHQMPDGTMMPGAEHAESGQQQVDPQIKQISDFFMMSIQQGKKPEEVVMMLIEKQVDQQTLAQAMMMSGMQQEDVMVVFKNIQEMQTPADPTAQEINQNPQELSREQYIESDQDKLPVLDEIDPLMDEAKSGIEIKKKNRGKFTRWAKARGMGVQEAARKVMANKEKYSPAVVKMANFAKNAAKFKKEEGGEQLPEAQYSLNLDSIKNLSPAQYNDKFSGKTDYKKDTEDVYKTRPDLHPKMQAAFDGLRRSFGTSAASRSAMIPTENDLKSDAMAGALANANAGAPANTNTNANNVTTSNVNNQIVNGVDYSKFFGPNISNGYVDAVDGTRLYTQQPGDKPAQPYNYNPVPDNGMNNLGRLYNFISNTNNELFSSADRNGDGAADGTFRDWNAKKNLNDIDRLRRSSVDFEIDVSPDNQQNIQKYISANLKAGNKIDPSVFTNFDLSNLPSSKRSKLNDFITGAGTDINNFVNNKVAPSLNSLGSNIKGGIGDLYNRLYEGREKAELDAATKKIITNDLGPSPIKVEDVEEVVEVEDSKFGGQLKQTPSGKKGKGIRKLPRQVRNNMGYMKYGGAKGEDVYLARKDAAIKASMNKAQDGNAEVQTSTMDFDTIESEIKQLQASMYDEKLKREQNPELIAKIHKMYGHSQDPGYLYGEENRFVGEDLLQEAFTNYNKKSIQYPFKDTYLPMDTTNFPNVVRQEGGEPDNQGFRALPDFVQDKIMKRQYGGNDLPEAQQNIPLDNFINNTTDFSDPNYFSSLLNNQGQTNYTQDTQNVRDGLFKQDVTNRNMANLVNGPYLGLTPQEQSNQNFLASLDTQTNNLQREQEAEDAAILSGANINPANFTFNPDTSAKGFAKDIYNSNAMKAFEGIGAFGVIGASVAKDFLPDPKNDAYIDLFNQTGADSQFNVQAPPFIRGKGLSANDAMFGSEDDATTGLFMNQGSTRTSKMGGDINNKTVNVEPAMLAKLIAAGADIEML